MGQTDKREQLTKHPFSYKITKDEKLMVYRDHKLIKVFKGKPVIEFESFAKTASYVDVQLKLAKLTGHYKHGNE